MVEQRLRCGSCTCKLYGSCLYTWKIWIFGDYERCNVFYNGLDHSRDERIECMGPHRAVITTEMKKKNSPAR